ncbi:hypothetical protein H4R19_000484 [Coemansia spiralis]|nr:hypothetical protein H4R19_000484 [Coemansia spiralis]
MLLRLSRVAVRPLARGVAHTSRQCSGFPLQGPSWSVRTLLRKPDSAAGVAELDRDLSAAEIVHLYSLAGLRAPDPDQSPAQFAQASAEVNRLRDFLCHIRDTSATEDLAAVEPLVRIAEPLSFTDSEPDGGLAPAAAADCAGAQVGQTLLLAAKQTSGPYFVVEASPPATKRDR